jgi:hypothetical protein
MHVEDGRSACVLGSRLENAQLNVRRSVGTRNIHDLGDLLGRERLRKRRDLPELGQRL